MYITLEMPWTSTTSICFDLNWINSKLKKDAEVLSHYNAYWGMVVTKYGRTCRVFYITKSQLLIIRGSQSIRGRHAVGWSPILKLDLFSYPTSKTSPMWSADEMDAVARMSEIYSDILGCGFSPFFQYAYLGYAIRVHKESHLIERCLPIHSLPFFPGIPQSKLWTWLIATTIQWQPLDQREPLHNQSLLERDILSSGDFFRA